ncbi:hypothetical protein I4U23_009935 [Adineta vaga]|nr:hypothetical protein I4U23_009935 [Adineta vaga]
MVDLPNRHESEYTAIIVGRDLSSYLTALILKQHGYQVAIVSRSKAPQHNLRSIHCLSTKGLQCQSDEKISHFDWQKLTNECKKEFQERKQHFEKEIYQKDIVIYEGIVVMIEDHLVRILSEDQLNQIAVLRTEYVILGSDICHLTIKDYINKTNQHRTLKTLSDIVQLEEIPKSLVVIGGGVTGISVASCMKELGCTRVDIIEQQSHCLMDVNNIDREIASYIESILIQQQINIITKYRVNYLTETTLHSMHDFIKNDYRFIAIGTQRKLNSICQTPSSTLIQLIERVSHGRQIQLGTLVDDGNGRDIVKSMIPIIPIDYQRVKNICSIEQAVSIAYRTICRIFMNPKPKFVMSSFIYTIPPLLILGQTRIPADNMFICRVIIPSTMKYVVDTLPRGFAKLWLSRTHKILCGVQLINEHAPMFGRAFSIIIRNELLLEDLCQRIEIPGSVGEGVQMMLKQALYNISRNDRIT